MDTPIYQHRSPLTEEQIENVQNNDLVFQALSWHEEDIPIPNDDASEEKKQYVITVHGVMQNGFTVGLRIYGFVPYFYILIPKRFYSTWNEFTSRLLFQWLKKKLGKKGYGLVSYKLLERTKLYPFENMQKHKFLRLGFSTQMALNACKYVFKEPLVIPNLSKQGVVFEQFETNIQSVLRFTHIRNIRMTGWIRIKEGEFTIEEDEFTRAQIGVTTFWKQVHHEECDNIAPFVILGYDLECQSSRGYPEFPDPDLRGDYISQIGCTFWEFGENTPKHKVVFTCVKSDLVDDCTIINCANEKDLLKSFCLLVEREDPDMLIGYNTWGFDDTYLWKRMVLNKLSYFSDKLSRLVDTSPKLVPKTMSSSAYGHNQFNIISMFGRESFDVCFAIRREHKLGSFKLDNVAKHFLGDEKVKISIRTGYNDPNSTNQLNEYEVLFMILDKKDPKEISVVCEYCAHDSLLPILLMEKLCLVPNYIEMAKSTRVPIDWLLLKGQQCKVFSQIAYEARLRNYVIPVINNDDSNSEKEKYKGATVLHALRGAYFEPVAGLDFKSLYPSIMIAYNMCHSTIVLDEEYMNLPGIEYETVSWYEEDKDKHYSYTFVQNIKGVLPDILERLWESRNQTKKEMKLHKGTFKEKVLNGKQLAIKVTMNSAYGFAGANKGMLPCIPIAASVTAKGREMIAQTAQMAQELYSCVAVYGDTDSCYVKFLVQKDKFADDNEYMEEIFRLSEECAKTITETFKKPIELEFEKVMYPFFLYQKKRYSYLEWVRGKDNKIVCEGLEYKGIEIVRRDFCQFVKETGIGILNTLMYDRDVDKAKEFAKSSVLDLLTDKVSLDKLVVSKSLNKTYKVDGIDMNWDDPRVKHPHVQVAQRIKQVDPMNCPKPPERVPYIFIKTKNPKALQYEKVEHPDYLGKTQKVDSLYYFEHQLQNSIDSLFDVVMEDPGEIYKKEVEERNRKDRGLRDIRTFFNK